MSFEFNNAVQKLRPLSGHAVRLVLWYLADHASADGTAYASYETLMSRCQIKSRTTIIKATDELEQLGILRKIHRPNQCVKYQLLWTGIKLHTITDMCLAPGCENPFYKIKDEIPFCQECFMAYPEQAEHLRTTSVPHPYQSDTTYSDNSNDPNEDSPELTEGNLGEPRAVDSTVHDTPGSTLSDIPGSIVGDIPGSTLGEFGSTLGDTLSTCIPSEKSLHLERSSCGMDIPPSSIDLNSPQTPKPETNGVAERLRICRHSQLASACKKCERIEETRKWAEVEL